AGAADILQAMSAVAEGNALLDPSVQRRLVEAIVSGEIPEGPSARDDSPGPDAEPPGPAGARAPGGLTPRQAEVLTAIAAALATADSPAKRCVPDTTVKTLVNHLLVKTGVRDGAQLAAYAFRLGRARLAGLLTRPERLAR